MPSDLMKHGVRAPSQEAIAADLKTVDANTAIRTSCLFRGTYDGYPRQFTLFPCMADLTPEGILLRPMWLIGRKFRVTEEIVDAHVRPRNPRTDWNLRATGAYAADGRLSYLGLEVITCRTAGGTIEIAVPRADVPLMLHYISRRKAPFPKE